MGFKDATRKVVLDEVRTELGKILAQLRGGPTRRRVLKT
jgi:hypothetical protein